MEGQIDFILAKSKCMKSVLEMVLMCNIDMFTPLFLGLFLVVGQILYPIGWGSQRVRNMCGENAGPFLIDECQLGKYLSTITLTAFVQKETGNHVFALL